MKLCQEIEGLLAAAATAAASAAATTTAATAATTAGATTTAAADLEVGVADDEAASHQAVHIVDLRAFDKWRRFGVNKDLDAGGFDYQVVRLRLAFHAEHVLETAVRAWYDHHPQQSAGLALLVQYFFELL